MRGSATGTSDGSPTGSATPVVEGPARRSCGAQGARARSKARRRPSRGADEIGDGAVRLTNSRPTPIEIPIPMMMRALLFVLLVCAPFGVLCGQGALISSTPSCLKCRILVGPQTLLQFPAGGELGIPPIAVREDSKGRIWVFGGGLPQVFDENGRYLSTLGRDGGGPGEFRIASDLIVMPGDSIGIIDLPAARLSVLDGSLKFVRSISLPLRLKSPIVKRWPDSVIMTGHAGTPASAGWPLHLVSFRGETARIVKSFGPGRGDIRPGQMLEINHRLARVDNGRFLSFAEVEYSGFVWDWSGTLKSTLSRRPAWFEKRTNLGVGTPKVAPPPGVSAVWVGDDELVWVATRSAAQKWQSAWSRVSPFSRDVSAQAIEWDRLFESHIEVLDGAQQRLISGQKLDGWIVGILQGPRLVRYTTDANGDPALVVEKVTMSRI